MAQYKSFKDIFRNIEKSVNTSTTQALNKASSATKTQYARTVSEELGIPQSKIKKRARTIKASKSNPETGISIGTKIQLAAHEFKPKKINVSTSKGKRTGATYTVKSKGTIVAPGGFLAKGKSSDKKIILQRTSSERYPLKVAKTDVFAETVEKLRSPLSKFLRDKFDSLFRSQLDYNLNKKK